ncbi:hypothetical protein STEG23_013852, partial [Scotinomys teguina]
ELFEETLMFEGTEKQILVQEGRENPEGPTPRKILVHIQCHRHGPAHSSSRGHQDPLPYHQLQKIIGSKYSECVHVWCGICVCVLVP